MRERALAAAAVALLATACGGSGVAGTNGAATTATPASGAPRDGGTLLAGSTGNIDHVDPALSYTNQGWELLEATNDGLLRLRAVAGAAGNEIVPDIARSMPRVSDGGRTYTFTLRKGVRFSPPVNREVRASDFKFSIERLFRVDSGGVGFYTGIVGANRYAKTRTGGISGIVASDRTRTITFHLVKPDGTFLDYMAVPFAFVMPKGTPGKDVSTIPAWRIATGPYMVTKYVPAQQYVIKRNPNFKVWTPATPNGHLDEIDVKIGVDPEQAANMTADGQLDWSFDPVAPDRYTELRARYPKQVQLFDRSNVTYFFMNERKPPFDKLAVRQALNYATDRLALVKIFGGQGRPTENILPDQFGTAFVPHHLYPYDLAKAKQLVKRSGDAGMTVQLWGHNTDPTPKAVQYMASVLQQLGFKPVVKTFDESVYWDTVSNEKTDPQMGFQDWNQDYPEGQDFIDVLLNGRNIVPIGNNNDSNTNIPALNRQIEAAKRMPLGPARNARWAALDLAYSKHAPWVVFMHRQLPKFFSARLQGVVFNPSYYELFPSMWLAK
jgi:peptide/nickel transport system substrate-binding protein